jgi:hypothetical protein
MVDLWSLFRKFGRVWEVYIPKKLDKRGKRFGFVKFKDVTNAQELEKRMENVWWETYKLIINLSRFRRGEVKKQQKGKLENKVDAGPSSDVDGQARCDERTFKEALTVGDNPKTLSPAEGFSEEISKAAPNAFEIKVNERRLEMLQNSFVGYLVDEKEAVRVPEGLIMEGYDDIQATFMGGNMMLLHDVTKGVIQEAVKLNGKWWEGWFRRIEEWSPETVHDRRLVWLRCLGVPLHAWEESLFCSIASSFGTWLETDPVTLKRKRLDVARFKISTSKMYCLDKELNISVLGKQYKVFVMEEREGGLLVGGEEGLGSQRLDFSSASVEQGIGREADEEFSDGNIGDGGTEESESDRVDFEEQGNGQGCITSTRYDDERNEIVSELGRSTSRKVMTGGTKEVVSGEKDGLELCDRCEGDRAAGTVDIVHEDNDVSSGAELESKEGEDVGPSLQLLGVGAEVNLNSDGPIVNGPASFGSSEDIEAAEFSDEEVREGNELGPSNSSQEAQVQHIGVGGLVVVSFEDQCLKTGEEEGVEISNPTLHQMLEKCIQKENTRKMKEKLQKAQSNLVGNPTCLKLVEALKGGRGKNKNKGGIQKKQVGNQAVEDPVVNINSECSRQNTIVEPGGIGAQNCVSGALILLNNEDQEGSVGNTRESVRLELEARKILDIQQGLGINCRAEEKEVVQNLIHMEVRDQQEIADWEQSNGYP